MKKRDCGIWMLVALMFSAPAIAQGVIQNNRSSQFQTGAGKLVLDALKTGHPGCYQRLTYTYPIETDSLVSREGIIFDKNISKRVATGALLCALSVNKIVGDYKPELMGLPARAARQILEGAFKKRLGEENKRAQQSFGEMLNISVVQSEGFKRPYIVEHQQIHQVARVFTVGENAPSVEEQSPGSIDGGKLDAERSQFVYWATGRINAFSATHGNFLINFREGGFKVQEGGRPVFDLSSDIVAGQKITIDDSGSVSFDVVI